MAGAFIDNPVDVIPWNLETPGWCYDPAFVTWNRHTRVTHVIQTVRFLRDLPSREDRQRLRRARFRPGGPYAKPDYRHWMRMPNG